MRDPGPRYLVLPELRQLAAKERQQMMMHLDIEVDDLAAAVDSAVELGAIVAEFQPQRDVRVLFDPVGHPFCLYLDK